MLNNITYNPKTEQNEATIEDGQSLLCITIAVYEKAKQECKELMGHSGFSQQIDELSDDDKFAEEVMTTHLQDSDNWIDFIDVLPGVTKKQIK